MSVQILVEGGGDTTQLRNRCREGFRKLLENCGFRDRMPKLSAVGSRESAFDRFNTVLSDTDNSDFVALLIDSEDPVTDIERTWDHLRQRDGWSKPEGATDDQILFMTTSMETWMVADRSTLRNRFARDFNENRLPPLVDLERRRRDDVLTALERATNGRYVKKAISFELLGALDPSVLQQHLPSFRRARRILNEKLGS